ncbi:Fe2+/Zn2+ uptake regulation protein [Prochlorococcus marinus subsp. marinus str. CCMP1375]|uniref:Fe2+/Zn2+ uptake regulation protein n=1 Tax=Prochlorococcus marinus (strain SARG / CCMP1375 / SS120) TaxID=167539 RepID=Q7VAG1_PROMA|nr:Fe2+/Zn2+ uptake regulation protein [Prochlorococcus marinus subsp. marinus str. CCMP1375]
MPMDRSTPEISERQKQLLQELKKCNDELSGQELHRQLHQSENAMGLATVYRNLQVLVKQGLVRSRHLPTGEVLYTPVERDIHHLTCVNCGETTRLEGCPVNTMNVPKKTSEKFELLFHTLEFFGLCQNCLQKKES